MQPLANGDLALCIAWSGDVLGKTLGANSKIEFVVPDEGGILWVDNMAIPEGAANPIDAHMMMDFVYQPKINALETTFSYYGSPLKRSLLRGTVARKLLGDKVVFPPTSIVKRLELNQVSASGTRLRERIWTEFKAA